MSQTWRPSHLARAARAGALLLCVAPGACVSVKSSANPHGADARAPAQRPTSTLRSARPWSFGDAIGQALQTQHYRIFTTARNTSITALMPAFLEQALTQYRTTLVALPAPRGLLDVYLLDNRPQWRRLAQWRLGRGAEAFAQLQRGGFASGGVAYYFDIGPRDTFAIAAHEGWHQYAQRTFREPLPIWLEEGVATFMEGKRRGPRGDFAFLPWANLERFDRLRDDATAGRLLSLSTLLSISPAKTFADPSIDPLTYYAQVWALIHFLHEGDRGAHRASLGALLLDATKGQIRAHAGSRKPQAILRTYFNMTIEEADARYQSFVRRIVQPGGRAAVVSGTSPIARPAGVQTP